MGYINLFFILTFRFSKLKVALAHLIHYTTKLTATVLTHHRYYTVQVSLKEEEKSLVHTAAAQAQHPRRTQ